MVTQQQSKVIQETEHDPFEDNEDEPGTAPSPTSPGTVKAASKAPYLDRPVTLSHTHHHSSFFGSKKDKKDKDKKTGKKKPKPFNLELEKPAMQKTIAEAAVASTNLLNALQFINREHQQVSENTEAVDRFESCKLLRRRILRYVGISMSSSPQKSLT